MKKKQVLKTLILLLLCLFIGACKNQKPNYLAYLDASFHAEIEGRLHGNDFSAYIAVENPPLAPHTQYSITYLAPAELEGITVTVLRDSQTGEESLTASLGELSLSVTRESVAGWLLPLDALLSVSGEEIESLQKTKEGYRLVFPHEKTVTVDETGLPLSLHTEDVAFSVTKIRQLRES